MLKLVWTNSRAIPEAGSGNGIACFSGFLDETVQGDVVVPFFRVVIPNPGIGGFFNSAGIGKTAEFYDGTILLAKGRLSSMPVDLGGDTIELEFTCVPADEDEVLKEAADALRIGELEPEDPYDPESPVAGSEEYDPLFYSRDASDDPTNVLAARCELWRWHRTTLNLERVHLSRKGYCSATSLSGTLSGGTHHEIGLEGFEGALRVASLEPPRALTKLRVVAAFTQEARGTSTFPCIDPTEPIKTYSFDDLVAAWPAEGTPVGQNTGWTVAESRIESVSRDLLPDVFDVGRSLVNDDPSVVTAQLMLSAGSVAGLVRLGYDYTQQREEYLDVEMPAHAQRMMGDDRKELVDVIQLAPLNIDHVTPHWVAEDPETLDPVSYNVGDVVQANGRRWECVAEPDETERFRVGKLDMTTMTYTRWWKRVPKRAARTDETAPTYFDTDRGTRSVRHALRRLKRIVLRRAHCIEVSFDCAWEDGIAMSTRDTCTVTHRLLRSEGNATGTATGKVVSVRLVADGSGRRASVTMHVPAGSDEEIETEGGTTIDGDVSYKLKAPTARQPVNAAALPAQLATVTVVNGYAAQKSAALFEEDPVAKIQQMPTRVQIDVIPIQEEDMITRRLQVTVDPLPVPVGIQL